jgi:hypothetical protein
MRLRTLNATSPDAQREMERFEMAAAARRIARQARFLAGLFILAGLVGLVAGLGYALSTDPGSNNAESRQALGYGIAIGSVVQASVIVLFINTAALVAKHIRFHAPQARSAPGLAPPVPR